MSLRNPVFGGWCPLPENSTNLQAAVRRDTLVSGLRIFLFCFGVPLNSARLAVCLFVYMSFCLYVCPSVCLSIYLSIYRNLSVCPTVCLIVDIYACLSICQSAYLSVCLPIYNLSIYLLVPVTERLQQTNTGPILAHWKNPLPSKSRSCPL